MSEKNIFEEIPKEMPMGIFGDTNFPVGKWGQAKKVRRHFNKKFKGLIRHLKVPHVWLVPTNGTNAVIFTILKSMKIPYTIVVPYKGYCDNMLSTSKLQLYFAIKGTKGKNVITLQEDAKNMLEQEKAVLEKFIAERCPVIACFHDDHPTPYVERLRKTLPDVSCGTLLMVNYGLEREG